MMPWQNRASGGRSGGASTSWRSGGRAQPGSKPDPQNSKVREASIGYLQAIGCWPKGGVSLLPGIASGTTVWDPYATPEDDQGSAFWREFGAEMAMLMRQLSLSKATTAGGVLIIDPIRFGTVLAGVAYDVATAVQGEIQEAAEKVGVDLTTGADAQMLEVFLKLLGKGK